MKVDELKWEILIQALKKIQSEIIFSDYAFFNILLGEGTEQLEFDGSGLPSGVYYYRIVAEDLETGKVQFSHVKKMLMVK